jgi:DNA-binding NarL/FixJ family response regulator
MAKCPRILIADDHAIVRQGLRAILEPAFPDAFIGEAQDARQVVCRVRTDVWDILMLDLSLPGESGFEVLRRIQAISPQLPVLFLSMHSEACFAVRAIRAGAHAYVGKDAGREELIAALRAVLAGEKYVSVAIAATIEETGHRLPA